MLVLWHFTCAVHNVHVVYIDFRYRFRHFKVPNLYLEFSVGVLPLTLDFSIWLIVKKNKKNKPVNNLHGFNNMLSCLFLIGQIFGMREYSSATFGLSFKEPLRLVILLWTLRLHQSVVLILLSFSVCFTTCKMANFGFTI